MRLNASIHRFIDQHRTLNILHETFVDYHIASRNPRFCGSIESIFKFASFPASPLLGGLPTLEEEGERGGLVFKVLRDRN